MWLMPSMPMSRSTSCCSKSMACSTPHHACHRRRRYEWAAAVAGVVGVEHAIDLLQQEVERDMGMLGINHIADINRECLA